MILQSQLVQIGKIGKPHGIDGEMTLILDDVAIDAELDVDGLRCVVLDIDGIYVPFFIDSFRPKSSESLLVMIDGVVNENEAKLLSGKKVYALKEDFDPEEYRDPDEGMYAADLIGFDVFSNDVYVGVVDDIEDSTENALFIIAGANDSGTVYVPIADEMIAEIDSENRKLYLDLPDGLLEL